MEQISVNLIPSGIRETCHASQFDVGRHIRFALLNGRNIYTLSGTETITLIMRKPNGTERTEALANTSSTYVDLVTSRETCDQSGAYECEIKVTDGAKEIGSGNFRMQVEADALDGITEEKTASGAIASFESSLAFPLTQAKFIMPYRSSGYTELTHYKASSNPTYDKKPYIFRKSKANGNEYNKLVGGTVAFNQLIPTISLSPTVVNGVTWASNNDGTITASGTATANSVLDVLREGDYLPIAGHKYYLCGCPSGGSESTYRLRFTSGNISDLGNGKIFDGNTVKSLTCQIMNGYAISGTLTFKPMLIDLTAMFGSTIADYIYSLEQATAGAGVAWFRNLFGADYYPYNAGGLLSVKTSKKVNVGFNQWDEIIVSGKLTSGGDVDADVNRITTDYIRVLPNTDYYIKAPNSAFNGRYAYYDENKNLIVFNGNGFSSANITTISGACYLRITLGIGYGTTYDHDICINISSDLDGTYQPYVSHEYPLDDVDLRGIPKLDANNNLFYDGDEYSSDGKVLRKYVKYICTGDEDFTWYDNTSTMFAGHYGGILHVTNFYIKTGGYCKGIASRTYEIKYQNADKTIYSSSPNRIVIINDSYHTQNEWIASLAGLEILMLLDIPASETADTFTNPMLVDGNGTEEFVDTRAVKMPAGHDSIYGENLSMHQDSFDLIYGGEYDAVKGEMKSMYNADGTTKATPDIIAIDKEVIMTFVGMNKVWHDDGNTEVKFIDLVEGET